MDERFKEKVERANGQFFASQDEVRDPMTGAAFAKVVAQLSKRKFKAPGLDGITNWMLVWGADALESHLLALFSNMWRNSVVPVAMSKVQVAYIHKGKDPLKEIVADTGGWGPHSPVL